MAEISRPRAAPVEAGTPQSVMSVTLTWLWPEAMIVVAGEVDHFSAPVLAHRLDESIEAGARRVTLDASGMTFVDAAGMRTLVTASRMLRAQGGDLVILDARPGLIRIMTLLGLDSRLTLMSGYR